MYISNMAVFTPLKFLFVIEFISRVQKILFLSFLAPQIRQIFDISKNNTCCTEKRLK